MANIGTVYYDASSLPIREDIIFAHNGPGNVCLGQGHGGVGLSASLSLPRPATPIIVDRVGNFNPRLRRRRFLMNTIVLDIYLLL